MGYYSKEIDKLFNTKHYTDIIKRPDLAVDEIVHNRPIFATIPFEFQWWLSCNICLGLILIDKRKHYQERPCEKCRNLFRVRKTGFNSPKYQFIKDWRHPEQARLTVATL
jgi:hypothetical protein